MNVVRTPQGIAAVFDVAQRTAFAAEDAGFENEHAQGVYAALQWLTGNTDVSPVDGYEEEPG
jgi:hypothetical protein